MYKRQEVARLGGDEFGLLLRVQSAAEAQLALDRLVQVVRRPIDASPDHAPADAASVAEETPTSPMGLDRGSDEDRDARDDDIFGSAAGTPGDVLRLSASVARRCTRRMAAKRRP